MSIIVKSFKDLSPARRALAVVLFTISIGVVAAAQRDLKRRPDAQLHGSKLLWRLVCLNALGAGAYFRWGRREEQ
jgi:hypothetical protein